MKGQDSGLKKEYADMSELASRNEEGLNLDLPNPITRRIGMFRSAWDRVVLAWHLFSDERVSWVAKLIPVLVIGYLISPVDFLPEIVTGPLGLLDDLTILILGLNWFIQVAPRDIVQEHMREREVG
jgi:uncharacterized membrane protein YkvA (DUF1232 family)